MANPRTLLLIDGDCAHVEAFRDAVLTATDGPFRGECVKTLAAGMELLRAKEIWAIFVNLRLSDSKGLPILEELALAAPGVPIMVLAGAKQTKLALEALRRGAKDYLLEDQLDRKSFVRAIRNMAERQTVEETLFIEKERAQVTLNSIGDAVLSTDMAGRVTYLNVVAEKMTGWARSEASGKFVDEVFKIIDGTTREPCPNPLNAAMEYNKT